MMFYRFKNTDTRKTLRHVGWYGGTALNILIGVDRRISIGVEKEIYRRVNSPAYFDGYKQNITDQYSYRTREKNR